jgi:hypothetical protein
MSSPGRNSLCTCGSGERYKDCCGKLRVEGDGTGDALPATTLAVLMRRALAAQQAQLPLDAQRLYREALAIAPNEPDALHMLGVLRYGQGHGAEAARLILRALDLTGWKHESFIQNLGLALAHAYRSQADAALEKGLRRKRELERHGAWPYSPECSVAVVVPCYDHERYVRRALESVFSQEHRNIEIVVIDDGSSDASADTARSVLAASPFPARFVAQRNRGTAATINEAISMSSSPFINVLNSDDWFTPDRIGAMLAAVAKEHAHWAFSDVLLVDEDDLPAVDSERGRVLDGITRSVAKTPTRGFAFVTDNAAISSGNIFFSRALFDRIGPFSDLRYNHDWDFCLRALRVAEPAYAPSKTYGYRLHSSNTIAHAASGGGRQEADGMLGQYIGWAMGGAPSENPVAPTWHNWGMHFLCWTLGRGLASLHDGDVLRQMALNIDENASANPWNEGVSPVGTTPITAAARSFPKADFG